MCCCLHARKYICLSEITICDINYTVKLGETGDIFLHVFEINTFIFQDPDSDLGEYRF